jgi:hypothetical protein
MMRSLSDMTANGLCRRALACLDQSDYRRLDQLLVDARRDSRLRKYVNDYPSLGVEISEAELGVMRQLFPATGAVPPNTEQVAIAVTDPIAKLLYALIWKNGEANRLPHILRGVEDVHRGIDGYPSDGLVMYQFGRSLADPSEPIVDRHTMRAFRLLESMQASGSPDLALRSKVDVTPDDVVAYKAWLNRIDGSHVNMRVIDMALFFVGKACKKA